jgi:hypothetical protein
MNSTIRLAIHRQNSNGGNRSVWLNAIQQRYRTDSVSDAALRMRAIAEDDA